MSTTVGTQYTLNVGSGGGGSGPAAAGIQPMHIVAPSQGSEAANSGGSSFTMDAESITLTVGQSSLTLKQDGTVELNGKTIAIAGSQHIGLDSERIDLN